MPPSSGSFSGHEAPLRNYRRRLDPGEPGPTGRNGCDCLNCRDDGGTQESRATVDDSGVVWPSRVALYSVMALQSDLNPKLIDLARDLSGGAMLMLPSSHLDYANADIAKELERYVASPGYPSKDRVALLKLAWISLVASSAVATSNMRSSTACWVDWLTPRPGECLYSSDGETARNDRHSSGLPCRCRPETFPRSIANPRVSRRCLIRAMIFVSNSRRCTHSQGSARPCIRIPASSFIAQSRPGSSGGDTSARRTGHELC